MKNLYCLILLGLFFTNASAQISLIPQVGIIADRIEYGEGAAGYLQDDYNYFQSISPVVGLTVSQPLGELVAIHVTANYSRNKVVGLLYGGTVGGVPRESEVAHTSFLYSVNVDRKIGRNLSVSLGPYHELLGEARVSPVGGSTLRYVYKRTNELGLNGSVNYEVRKVRFTLSYIHGLFYPDAAIDSRLFNPSRAVQLTAGYRLLQVK